MVAVGPQSDVSGVAIAGPTGPGWIIEMVGYHYYNDRLKGGATHLRQTLLKQLDEGFVDVPMGPGQPNARFTMKELGIGYPILAFSSKPQPALIPNPNFMPVTNSAGGAMPGAPMPGGAPAAGGLPGMAGGDPNAPRIDPNNPDFFKVLKYDFAIQFVWQEKPLLVRLAEREKAKQLAEEAAKAAASAPADGSAPPGAPAAPPGPADLPSGPPAPPPAAVPDAAVPNAAAPPLDAGTASPANPPPATPPAAPPAAPPVVPTIPDAP
jgi:type IV pilus assembly protein PilM